jgi:hypothetical protein
MDMLVSICCGEEGHATVVEDDGHRAGSWHIPATVFFISDLELLVLKFT